MSKASPGPGLSWSRLLPIAALSLALILSPRVGQAAEHIVRIVSDYDNLRMMFVPKYLNIQPGDQVTWINEANEEHNVITFPDGYPDGAEAFQSPIMTQADERFTHRFEVSGTYQYHCIPHLPMGMNGLIVVGRASAHDEFHKPSIAEIESYRDLMMKWFDEDDVEMLEREERTQARSGNLLAAIIGHENADRPQDPSFMIPASR